VTRAADEAIALAFAHGLPYAGLRDERNDDAIVPADAARAARVVALRADADRVRLAAAGPEPDLSALAGHLGGRRAEIVIAPRTEIDAILGPAAPAAPAVAEPAPIEPEPEPEPLAPEPEPQPAAADAGDEPSWLAPAPGRSRAGLVALVAAAIVLLAAGAAVAVWLTT
jgi:hypothetical protein